MKLQTILFSILLVGLLAGCSIWSGTKPAQNGAIPVNPNEIDMLLKVSGLDSSNVETVQAQLSAIPGIKRNFACYTDSNIFVKFDSTQVKVETVIETIKAMGFKVHVDPQIPETSE